MGTTFCSFHLRHGREADIAPLLSESDVVRTINAPWLSVLPPVEEVDSSLRMSALARKTRDVALLFCYLDDDEFLLTAWLDGKKLAVVSSDGQVTGAKKLSLALRGDASCEKPLRMISKCAGLEEQTELLEEMFGVALYDMAEMDERRVGAGDAVFRRVAARMWELAKRPNRYRVSLLDRSEWPRRVAQKEEAWAAYWIYRETHSREFAAWLSGSCNFLADPADPVIAHMMIPRDQSEDMLQRTGCRESGSNIVALFYAASHTHWEIISQVPLGDCLCLTSDGMPVCCTPDPYRLVSPLRMPRDLESNLVCLNDDGSIRWRFNPGLQEKAFLCCHYEPVRRVIAACEDAVDDPRDALFLLVDPETGQEIARAVMPSDRAPKRITWRGDAGVWVGASRGTKEVILLNDALQEIRRISLADQWFDPDSCRFGFDGCLFLAWPDAGSFVTCVDLKSAEVKRIRLEIPVFYILQILRDGTIVAVPESEKTLYFFDPYGTLISGNSVKGEVYDIGSEDGMIYARAARNVRRGGEIVEQVYELYQIVPAVR